MGTCVMSFEDLADKVERCAEDATSWLKVRDEIISRHENATTVDEYITLLSLHKMLMDNVERKLPSGVNIEEIKALKSRDYKMLLKREYIIGGSVCIDTLYELTQRELEAGRMGPEDKLINLAVDAIAEPHYSREQLLRQEEKINKTEKSSTLGEKLSRIFK
jgi:hypothetical protein